MSFHIGIGVSRRTLDSRDAGCDAASEALGELSGQNAQMVVMLASPAFTPEETLAGVREVFPNTPVVGCSTAGLITNEGPVEKAVGVLALSSDAISFVPLKIENLKGAMRESGKRFGEMVKELTGGKAKGAFIFSDPLSGNGTELVRGVFGVLGTTFPLIGGAAGDDMAFKKTHQYFGDQVLSDAAVGFAVLGNVSFAAGADHGWKPLGKEYKVTKAEGTKLYELDGKPAFSIYEEHFADQAKDFKSPLSLAAVTYPLGMKVEGSSYYMIRVPLVVGEDGSIVCGAEVLPGSTIRLMIGDTNSALDAAEAKAKSVVEQTADSRPRLAFLSDCVARKVLFGANPKKEIERLAGLREKGITLFGFYSYGQIAPNPHNPADVNKCDPGFYEQSLSIAVMGEE